MVKKIIWISSYLPRSCGIAFYSQDYLNALRNHFKKKNQKVLIKIIAHTDAKQADYPVIDNVKDVNWHEKVFRIIKKERPDVVHIQHEYGLFETKKDNNERLLVLIKKVRELGIRVFMTYHSVYEKLESYQKTFVSESLKILNAGIFHEQYQKDALLKNIKQIPENVEILPHGSEEGVSNGRERIRKEFGYKKNDLIVGAAGLADERKGFRTLIKQWPKVFQKIPNAKLVIEVKPLFAEQTRIYINNVLKEIMKCPVSESIEFIVKDYKKEEFYKRLKSFDVLVLPYKSESQSGLLAHGFAAGTPAIVTDIEGLGAEIRNSNGGIAVKNRKDFYKVIVSLLKNKRLRKRYSENIKKYVKNVNGWSIIARKTVRIWEEK